MPVAGHLDMPCFENAKYYTSTTIIILVLVYTRRYKYYGQYS